MAASNRAPADGVTTAPTVPKWREFRDYSGVALEWVKAGNVAVTPGIIERIGGGAAMYMHTRDAATFAIAARALDMDPRSVPEGRTGSNVDGEALLRALICCRIDSGFTVPSRAPWVTSRCPECGGPFHKVAAHMLIAGDVPLTSLACASGHRWPL